MVGFVLNEGDRRGLAGRRALALLGSAAALLLAAAGPALANSYTPVLPPPGAELSHLEIFDLVYGGAPFVQTDENFSNGTIDALRVFDANFANETIHIVTGDENDIDQIWTDGVAIVSAEAKFAALGQSFGWNAGGSSSDGDGATAIPGDYVELLTDADIGGPAMEVMITGDFLWGVNPSSGDTWWSRQSQNGVGEKDHLVTYKINGLPAADPAETVWLLFWEDLPPSGDDDFNDFVVQITATVPEPSTGLLLLGGLLLALGAAPRRK